MEFVRYLPITSDISRLVEEIEDDARIQFAKHKFTVIP